MVSGLNIEPTFVLHSLKLSNYSTWNT